MTTQDTGIDNSALIEEMLRDAEPVNIQPDEPVVHRGDEELEAPMVARTISSAGYVYVWDTETGEKVPILYYMLPQQMRKKRADGQPRFSAKKPAKEPWRGTIKCLLHKDNPQRAYFDTLGFRYCKKDNIQNPHSLTQHMRLKHPQEWKFVEEQKKEKERQEDRELQKAILGRVAGEVEPQIGTPEAPLYISDKHEKKKRR